MFKPIDNSNKPAPNVITESLYTVGTIAINDSENIPRLPPPELHITRDSRIQPSSNKIQKN